MFIQNAVLKSINAEGLSFPLAEGSVVSVGGVTGIIPGTLDIRPATNRIYVAVAGTIDLTSDANKCVTFTDEQIQELGADFNFVPAVEFSGGGGGGGGAEKAVFNILEDDEGDLYIEGGKTIDDVDVEYVAGKELVWQFYGVTASFVTQAASESGHFEGGNFFWVYPEMNPDDQSISAIDFDCISMDGGGSMIRAGLAITGTPY